jgi:hypothetical protein
VPGGERLPVAPRERKPALAALAVLLILLGGLGASFMVIRAGNKAGYVEVTQPVAAGDQITEAAIREVMISDDSGLGLIRWEQRGDLIAHYRASVTLVPDSVLSNSMITKKDNVLTAGKSLVGLSLKDGQFPKDAISVGDTVDAYLVGNDAAKSQSGGSGSGATAGASPRETLIAGKLIVKSISTDNSGAGSGDTNVTVIADTSEVGPLTIAASANDVALVRVPSAGGN